MAKQVIITEGNELILMLKTGGGREAFNYNAEDVQTVSFTYVKESLFSKLFNKPVRRITVNSKKIPGGGVYFDEKDHKQYFETYLTDLKAFCKKYYVTFKDFPEK